MKQIELSVQIRNGQGSQKAKILREKGILPAIVYGEDQKPSSVQVLKRDFDRVLRQTAGETGIYHLQVMAGDKKESELLALLKDTQYDPVSDQVTHLDFLRISMDKEISIKVPIVLKGTAIGLKKPGATLEFMLRELEVQCLPKNIPQHIEIDVTNLDTHQSVHVGDVKLADSVKTKMDPGAAIVAVVFSTREAEPTAAGAEADAKTEPEVTKEKPKDAAAGAAPAAGAKAAPAAGAKAAPAAKK
jgi:large subunit ribosomal protein L25